MSPLDLVFGLLAKDASATAAKAIETCESGFSVLMMGSTKSNDPLEAPEPLGNWIKFDMKKQGAWSSTGTDREAESMEELDLMSEAGDITVFDASQLPSSSLSLDKAPR